MVVRSRDLGTVDDPLETGMIDEATVARWGVWLARVLVLILITYTAFGSFVPLAGGWDALRQRWQAGGYVGSGSFWYTVGLTLLFQGWLTIGQWGTRVQATWWCRRWQQARASGKDWEAFAKQRFVSWLLIYLVLLIVSSVPSAYTYSVWVWELIAGQLWAVVCIFLVSVVGDMIPEWVMVRKPASRQKEDGNG